MTSPAAEPETPSDPIQDALDHAHMIIRGIPDDHVNFSLKEWVLKMCEAEASLASLRQEVGRLEGERDGAEAEIQRVKSYAKGEIAHYAAKLAAAEADKLGWNELLDSISGSLCPTPAQWLQLQVAIKRFRASAIDTAAAKQGEAG